MESFRELSKTLVETRQRPFSREAQYESLLRIGEALQSSSDPRIFLQKVLALIVPAIADSCMIGILDRQRKSSQFEVASVIPGRDKTLQQLAARYLWKLDERTSVGTVIRSGKSTFSPDIPSDWPERSAIDSDHLELLKALDSKSLICVPIIFRNEVFGTIQAGITKGDRRFDLTDLKILEDAGRRVGGFVSCMRANEQRDTLNRAIREVQHALLHDFQRPLDLADSKLEQLSAVDEPEARRSAKVLRSALEELGEMTQELAETVSGAIYPVPSLKDIYKADDLLAAAVETSSTFFLERDQVVIQKLEAQSSYLHCDRDNVQQILSHLLVHVAKAAPEKSKVEIELKTEGSWVEFRAKCQAGSQKQLLWAAVEHSWVREVVDSHLGEIKLRTSAEKAPVITIRLPLVRFS